LNIKISIYKLVNLALRVGGMGMKFLLIIILSKFFSVGDYRNFTLIITFITLSIYVLGLDFYNFSIRDILNGEENLYTHKVVQTFFLYLSGYLIFGIIYYLFFNSLDFIKQYALIVFLIAVTEHFAQELYRLLIAFGKVLLANSMIFFRLFGWGIYVLFFLYTKKQISLNHILIAWFTFNFISILVILSFFAIKKYPQIISVKIERYWIIDGLKVSSIFFIGTVLLKIIEYANRFVIDYFLDDIYVGIYGFYTTIALIVTIYINTIVISFELPQLIKNKDISAFPNFRKSIIKQLFIIVIILMIVIFPLIHWQGHEQYKEYFPIFILILAGIVFMNLSLVEHYLLYIEHKDKRILYIMVITGAFSLFSAVLLTYLMGIYGTSISFLLTGMLMFILRKHEVKKEIFYNKKNILPQNKL